MQCRMNSDNKLGWCEEVLWYDQFNFMTIERKWWVKCKLSIRYHLVLKKGARQNGACATVWVYSWYEMSFCDKIIWVRLNIYVLTLCFPFCPVYFRSRYRLNLFFLSFIHTHLYPLQKMSVDIRRYSSVFLFTMRPFA